MAKDNAAMRMSNAGKSHVQQQALLSQSDAFSYNHEQRLHQVFDIQWGTISACAQWQ
jgi:hypothetical protein